MKVTFDPTQKIMGIGLVPWARLGPERWFSNYGIASAYDWDIDIANAPKVVALHAVDPSVVLPRQNTPAMLNDPVFQKLLTEHFRDTAVLAYKAVDVPEILKANGMKFLTNGTELAHSLENKAFFRRHFTPLGIPFPEYKIYDNHSLVATDDVLREFLELGDEVVVQDARLSGGKGTFMVSDPATLEYCFDALRHMKSDGTIVVSRKIPSAHERSVQCVATRYGVFVGPLQKQIIANPLLANLNVPDGYKFCGIELNPDDAYAAAYPEIKAIAEKIGRELLALGYKGIFGIDFLIDESGTVFVLEVNPRLTGATPLQTMLYRQDRDIPFYLLHILELTGAEYSIDDTTLPATPQTGSLLMVHAQNDATMTVDESVRSGLYDDQLTYRKSAIYFDDTADRQVLIQRYVPSSFKLKPGGRIACLFTNYPVLEADDTLSKNVETLVSKVQAMVKLERLNHQ